MNAAITALLEYQKIEAEIIKIDREIENNPNKQTANKMIMIVKDSQKIAEGLEQEAKQSVHRFNKVKAVYDENFRKAEKLNNLNLEKLSDEELIKVNNELENVLNTLNAVEKELINLNKNVETILERFEKAKQNVIIAKSNFQTAKVALDKAVAGVADTRRKYILILEKMAPEIDKQLLKKYMSLRQDKVFPVVVPLSSGLCGGCRMELPIIMKNKLRAQGYIECEHCHRIIYDNIE